MKETNSGISWAGCGVLAIFCLIMFWIFGTFAPDVVNHVSDGTFWNVPDKSEDALILINESYPFGTDEDLTGRLARVTGIVVHTAVTPEQTKLELQVGVKTVKCYLSKPMSRSDANELRFNRTQVTIRGMIDHVAENVIFLRGCVLD